MSAPLAVTGCGASGTIADKSGFEDADANLSVDKAGCMDWNGFAPVTWTGSVPYQTATKTVGNFTFFGASDAFNSNTDSSYAGGVKQADECPATGTGSVDNKTDIARIYVGASTDPVTKHVYLDLAWIRAPQNTTTSDVHIGFEFNQNKNPCGSGSPLVHRTAGDILLVYNFQSGTASIAYSQWTGSAWTPEVTLSSSVAEAAVFGGTTTTDAIKPSNGLDPATDEFGEAGIDLTAATASLGNNGRACERFGTAFGESRTSGSSTTAQMKDLVGPVNIDVSNCVTPGLTTTQQPATGAMGDTFKDKATLSGAETPDGTGSITFKLYSAADCGGSVLDTETVSGVNANGDYTTPTGYVLQNAGTYYWVASFSGDGYNNAKTTGCNDEPVTVAKASPSIVTTQQPATAVIGSTFKDKATLSNGVNYKGTGSITFTLYSAADCGGTVLDTETINNVSANGDYTTPNGFAIQNAGTYYWVASFSGDANNNSFTGGCNDEPVVVTKSPTSIVTTQQPASGSVADTYKDTATLSGGLNFKGTGTITFKLYNAADCGGSVVDTETVSNISANGDYTTPTGVQLNSAGTYYWVASYSGDANNSSYTSGCNDEPVVVNPASIKIAKTADAAQVNAGDQIGFTLTVYNTGAGNAYGVTLSDPLPAKTGLSWQIESQGTGWGGSCSITAGTLNCGPVTVPAGTTKAASTFTVHITSSTTAATGGVCPSGSGVVNNTGTVHTTNDGSDQASASTCVAAPSIKIVKTADAAQVSAGDQIGFTLTVSNSGSGDAYGVTLSDPLPVKAGLSWQIESQGAGWSNSCSITSGTLNCGPVTVPAGTTQAASTFTVHITSPTTSSTGGLCPVGSGVINNTGDVTTTNGGSDESSASTCVAGPAIHILKTADAAQVNAGDQIGFTLTVSNSGSGDAKGVTLTDPLPTNPGLSWQIESQGAGWGGSCSITAGTLTCGPAMVPAGTTQASSTFTVHITSTTTAATGGVCPDGSGVVDNTGSVTTTNDGSDQSSASTCVAAPAIHIVKTADATQVNAGDTIGFTLTVSNSGSGDAYGVTLSDPLPTNAGLSWQIAGTGAGWGDSCSIVAGTLTCGPATVPAGTTQAESTFTVHITSTTTAATAGDCPETGVVDNTGSVTTTNDGSDQSSASTCVAGAVINIAKTADAAQVNAGQTIGFTMTVWNSGTGDAKGVTLTDPLPTNAGLSWQIADTGAGWGDSCSIVAGTLTCGPVTVPAGTTQAASTFTVHITSTTTSATGGACPEGSGVVDNTGSVTTTNDGSDQSTASTCVQGGTDLQITKSGAPKNQDVPAGTPFKDVTWTMVVTNNGPLADTNVTVNDPMPVGSAGSDTYVSSSTTKGSCTGGAILSCSLGTLQVGESVTITLVTSSKTEGTVTNTATVSGDLAEATLTNNTASANVFHVHFFPPPTVCTALHLTTSSGFRVGESTTVHIKVTQKGKPVKGVKVRIQGPGISVVTKKSGRKGKITTSIRPTRVGTVTFKPVGKKACRVPTAGITNVFTSPRQSG